MGTTPEPSADAASPEATADGSLFTDPFPTTYQAPDAPLTAITGGTVLTATGARIEGGTVVLRDGQIVGYLSSGSYGHHLGGAIGMGYVPCTGETAEQILASAYEIDVAGTRVRAEASLKPLYDPAGARMKA